MVAFEFKVSSNSWSGGGFVLLDLVLMGILFHVTSRLASQLNRKALLRGEAINCRDIELPHVGGGIATKRGWFLAPVRLAAIACIAVYEFSVEGQSKQDIVKRSFHIRFDAFVGTGGAGLSESDSSTAASVLLAYIGKCSTPVGLKMDLYEGLIARGSDSSKTPQPGSLTCLNGKDSPKRKLVLTYEYLRNILSARSATGELSKWVPAPDISNPKLIFERMITSADGSNLWGEFTFNGSTVTSHCPAWLVGRTAICLVLLEAYDKTKFLFPYALNTTGRPFRTDDQRGLLFSGELPEGIGKAAGSYNYYKPTDSGEPVRATYRDLLFAISGPRDVKTEEEIFAPTSSSYTEVKLFGAVAAGVLLIMTLLLTAALLFIRTPLDSGAASYNELSATANKLLDHESLPQGRSAMLRFTLEEDDGEGYKLYPGKGV